MRQIYQGELIRTYVVSTSTLVVKEILIFDKIREFLTNFKHLKTPDQVKCTNLEGIPPNDHKNTSIH